REAEKPSAFDVNTQDDFADDVPLFHRAMRVASFFELESSGDRNLQLGLFDCAIQPFEFADAGHAVIGLDPDALALSRLGLDSVRIRRPPALPQRVEATRQLLAAGQSKHG